MNNMVRHIAVVVSLLGAFALELPVVAGAAQAPIKETLTSRFGWDVNKTKVKAGAPQFERNVCTTASGDECGEGTHDEAAGGFGAPAGVAVEADPADAKYGDVYVAEDNFGRIQVFTPAGAFVTMFGWKVNGNGGNVCTAAEEDECRAAQPVSGGPAGQIKLPTSITTDPATGDLYISDPVNKRIEKYTSSGEFIWMIGRDVNKKGGNICFKAEEAECQTGLASEPGSTEPAAFTPSNISGGNPPVVGPDGDLYVGDAGRVQQFEADGAFVRNIPVTGQVEALAVDSGGELYVAEELSAVIHKFDANGQEVKEGLWPVQLRPRGLSAPPFITALAMDPSGRLSVSLYESRYVALSFGVLLAGSGRMLTSYKVPIEDNTRDDGVAFAAGEVDGGFAMYTTSNGQEVGVYAPVPVAELVTSGASCVQGADSESDATFRCLLNGEVDAWGVKETEAWFQLGTSSPASERTESHRVTNEKGKEDEEEALVHVGTTLEGLTPNTTYHYQLSAYDHNLEAPEAPVSGETSAVTTGAVPPRIVDEPSAFFVTSSSAVLFGELNAENTATEYFFEYGEALGGYCEGALRSRVLSSSVYGPIGVALEVSGLQSGRSYEYRLCAVNDQHQRATGIQQGTLTTLPAPVPQASTGVAEGVGSSSATIAGSVDPGGQPATYEFELGLYAGTETQYGIVSSGSLPGSTTPLTQTLGLTGLQPATSYAFRIKAINGYGATYGATEVFTTAGLPAVLESRASLAMLALPGGAFPTVVIAKPTTKSLTNAQKLAKALTACKRERPAGKRTACQRQAHRKYPTKRAHNRKKG